MLLAVGGEGAHHQVTSHLQIPHVHASQSRIIKQRTTWNVCGGCKSQENTAMSAIPQTNLLLLPLAHSQPGCSYAAQHQRVGSTSTCNLLPTSASTTNAMPLPPLLAVAPSCAVSRGGSAARSTDLHVRQTQTRACFHKCLCARLFLMFVPVHSMSSQNACLQVTSSNAHVCTSEL